MCALRGPTSSLVATLGHEFLDGVRQMLLGDVMIAGLAPERVRPSQDVRLAHAFWRLELVAGQLQAQAVRIAEVDGIHEAAVERLERDAALFEALRHLGLGRARDVERDVLEVLRQPMEERRVTISRAKASSMK